MALQPVRLADYRPYPYVIDTIALDIALDADETIVRATLSVRRRGAAAEPLVLDGKNLQLRQLRLNGAELPADGFVATPDRLEIMAPPAEFTLETEVAIHPARNQSGKGLFWHTNRLITHCEAEGFRRITYFPDRPDVLATYTVRLEADRQAFPLLLSNGIPMESGEAGQRHWTLWRDPFPKPSYIFAVMAGRFETLRDHFTTAEGQEVSLAIHAEPGEAARCAFAMDSLKAAFRWDERVFGLSCDLPVYNVVALPAYAGAQENKGLNLFGADGIIADPAITTDEDFALIRRIIGHEYFHNWTGNRVTCRDWFQLSLKEGLTRLRDQLFMEDELEPGTYRIEQVKTLRRNQFPEDDGPAAHPVQPAEFVEIENFYTATIYEKGAELLRMLRTLVGAERFVAAIRAYLVRFDGQAVTIDDLFDTIEREADVDLAQFRRWLHQPGRPTVTVAREYDPERREARFTFSQRLPVNGEPGQPLHIPIAFALFDPQGGHFGKPLLIELRDWSQTLVIADLPRAPVPSILRQFSAPVSLEADLSDEELMHLAVADDDAFVAWNSAQQLFTRGVRELALEQPAAMDALVPPAMVEIARRLLADARRAPGLTALRLSLPDEPALSEGLDRIPLDSHMAARNAIRRAIGRALADPIHSLYEQLSAIDPLDLSAPAMSGRNLRSVLLDFRLAAGDEKGVSACLAQIEEGPSFTEAFEALCLLGHCDRPERQAAFEAFHHRYRDQPLVVDKWFKAYALSRATGVIDEIIALEGHSAFDISNTSRAVAYYGSLFRQNRVAFHDASGKGYRFLADRLLMMDQMGRGHPAFFMAQIDQWRRHDEPRQTLMREQLQRIAGTSGISRSLDEVVNRSLG
ncbi:aminopeptidase N [Sandaracinobacter neustonicus]|uniref:Aminopeptidase N n=1 Tax=Sandaracinobacter neustonicus TaxID=1715348 RepID=A0A501XK02_9SPHN|nr:aminopeptidase N [Sandaracinobacter neustonicus]TPE60991.1 aminopeptidase N [Sandaracinobacter neustonicus]